MPLSGLDTTTCSVYPLGVAATENSVTGLNGMLNTLVKAASAAQRVRLGCQRRTDLVYLAAKKGRVDGRSMEIGELGQWPTIKDLWLNQQTIGKTSQLMMGSDLYV